MHFTKLPTHVNRMQSLSLQSRFPLLTVLICLVILTQWGCKNNQSPVASVNRPALDASARHNHPDYQQVVSRIRDIVAKQLGIEPNSVGVDVPLSKQKVAADELDVIEIIINVEEAFSVEIKDEEISGPNGEISGSISVNKLAEIVMSKKKTADRQ